MTEEDLSDLPGPVRAELTRLRAERVVFVAEREKLLTQLREADASTRRLLADRDRLAEQVAVAQSQDDVLSRPEQEARDEALRLELANARRERDTLRAELTNTRDERDQLRLRLLDAELALAGTGTTPTTVPRPSASGQAGLAAAEARAAHLANELAATKATVSWRVTAPLRAVRRRGRPQ